MNQSCKVCGEPAAGFHFGAFTCEGCKSFFGRSYNNVSSISECKNNGKCVIDKKNRTTCKACRLRKCYTVGMSKGGSRYGRRSNWFKIHCLLQEQQQQYAEAAGKNCTNGFSDFAAAMHQHQSQQTHAQQAHMSTMLQYPYLYPGAGRVPPTEATAANSFLSMMHSMPYLGDAGSAANAANGSGIHLPHFLYPSFHPAAAMAAAANVDHANAYRTVELYKQHQRPASVDSAEYSADSQENNSDCYHERHEERKRAASPELLVSGDEDYHSASSLSPSSASSAPMHTILSPIAVRATALANINTCINVVAETNIESASTSFTKLQSLSPVSVCSIGAEATLPTSSANTPTTSGSSISCSSSSNNFTTTVTATIIAEDAPIDLSMKSLRSSVHCFSQAAVESGEDEESRLAVRRKFIHLSNANSNASSCSNDDDAANCSAEANAEKRSKLSDGNSARRVYAH